MAIDVTAKSATAVAYDSAANADAYFTARGITTWTGADSVKESALIRGADYLERRYRGRWVGVKTTQAQSLSWPRGWVTDVDGYAIDADTDLEPVLERGGAVTREKVKAGPVETETEYQGGASARTTITTIDGLLEGLVTGMNTIPLLRV